MEVLRVVKRQSRFVALVLSATLLLCAVQPELAAAQGATPPDVDQEERAQSDRLYREAQREIERQDHKHALALLREYLDFTRSRAHRPERVFWAIDQVGRVYLGNMRDPDGALTFFKAIREDTRLSDLDRAAIDEWIAVATEWKETRGEIGSGLRDAKILYDRARRYFDSGMEKIEGSGMSFATADFHIAEDYLRRFSILYDEHTNIGEVLYMQGAIRFHSRSDQEYWSDNFHLKEVIRRFPHTKRAGDAFGMLRREVTRAYDPKEIPADLTEQLVLYEELSRPSSPLRPEGP